jgi:hypothetical protein
LLSTAALVAARRRTPVRQLWTRLRSSTSRCARCAAVPWLPTFTHEAAAPLVMLLSISATSSPSTVTP